MRLAENLHNGSGNSLRMPQIAARFGLATCVLIALTMFPSAARAQGALTNGDIHTASISAPGEVDTWTFTASQNDSISLSIGEILPGGPDPGFAPWIRLQNPMGTQIAQGFGALVGMINVTAPLSGTYTVLVASADSGNDATGTYRLTLAKVPGAFVVPAGDQGGAMTNGQNHEGDIYVGDLDMWSFQASQNDSISLAIGEPDPGEIDPGFNPWIRLVGPTGVLVGSGFGVRVGMINVTAPLSGTYTVIVASADSANDATGSYLLTLAKIPGVFVVPDGDEGGSLTNGANHPGRIHVGDLDQWSFQAAQNDFISVSIGEPPFGEVDPGFNPWIRLIGPTGVLLGSSFGLRVGMINVTAPLSGTYTVLVSTADSANDAEGNYRLTLAKIPGTPVVPAEPGDDDGGPLLNGAIHKGDIRVGDLDQWKFQANQNDYIAVAIGEPPFGEVDPGFNPWIRLFGPTGVLLGSSFGLRVGMINVTAPLSGTYTVLVSTADSANDAEGNYWLTLARVPGTFVVSHGDQGGTITNATVRSGSIYTGDLDTWTFHATQTTSLTVAITEPPPGEVDPGFNPWIRLVSPAGVLLGSSIGLVTAQINVNAPLTGTYTVIVGSADSANDATGNYELTVVGVSGAGLIVTPSAGANGTITPNTPQTAQSGSVVHFTITPDVGYAIGSVEGTCGGTLSGEVFTTNPVTANCTVIANFIVAPTMTLDKTSLRFGVTTSNGAFVAQTAAQMLRLTQAGVGTVAWTATPNQPWLQVNPAFGTGSANLSVGVVHVPGLPPSGVLGASITFTLTGASNSAGPVAVTLTLIPNGTSAAPFGSVDTPVENQTGVTGAVPFTGWALDDVEVTRVAICRAAFGAEVAPVDPNCGGMAQIFVGFAIFIDGARPDVAAGFPTLPLNSRGGWGFMVLTNMLPSQGNGVYQFFMHAQDSEGHTTLLATRTMTCANASATLPFGAIDTPAQGGLATGASYLNFGWALTQAGKFIPFDGSTITVFVDGVPLGHPSYDHFRADIATLFPGLANSDGAVGVWVLDTTALANGLHTIAWSVTDNVGAAAGIGSRFFTVSNGVGSVTANNIVSLEALVDVPVDQAPVLGRRGWDLDSPWRRYAGGGGGRAVIRGLQIDRFELFLDARDGENYTGHVRVGTELAALPVGSHLDAKTGQFTWAPGVGFLGTYDLVFLRWADNRVIARRDVRVIIAPK